MPQVVVAWQRFLGSPAWLAARLAADWRNCGTGSPGFPIASAARVAAANRRPRPSRDCWRRWPGWCSRRSAATPRQRCCGSARASAIWPARWRTVASPRVKNWSGGCYAASVSACRQTARPVRGRATRTATPSSNTSTRGSTRSRPPDSRPFRSTRRRRSLLGTSRTAVANCAQG
jgi:hypothetical protein